MSRAPFVMGKASAPYQRRAELFDTTIGWRFVNPLAAQHFGTDSMPETAENVAELLNISQEPIRTLSPGAASSARRRPSATAFWRRRLCRCRLSARKGAVSDVREDEHPRPETTLEQLAKLEAPFRQGGVITAGNASRRQRWRRGADHRQRTAGRYPGLTPRARIVAMATAGVEPRLMGLGPVPAVRVKCWSGRDSILTIWI